MSAYWCRFLAGDLRSVVAANSANMHDGRFFVTGERMSGSLTVCVLIHAPDVAAAWAEVRRCFPEAACDSLEPVAMDWRPGDRFPGLEPLVLSASVAP